MDRVNMDRRGFLKRLLGIFCAVAACKWHGLWSAVEDQGLKSDRHLKEARHYTSGDHLAG